MLQFDSHLVISDECLKLMKWCNIQHIDVIFSAVAVHGMSECRQEIKLWLMKKQCKLKSYTIITSTKNAKNQPNKKRTNYLYH